ncbi:MAG: cytochrome C oxidase subunit IV family protein [Bacteroidetes bacterium]|nr:cytochrome C oxidase subunit IV family protein [Bacteroidota bacterium]
MERDDIIEYSLHAHHSAEEGVKIRKKIYFVTALLSIITIVEVVVGVFISRSANEFANPGLWTSIKIGYIALTLIKAGYIVLVFMHLGEERKHFKWMILAPYIMFLLYLIFIALYEAVAVGHGMTL